MERKYSIITGFMGKVQDRFIDYQPARPMEEMVEMAAKVKGCKGLEVVYPQNFTDPVKVKELLDAYGLKVSTVNLNVKGDQVFRFGSYSSPYKASRDASLKMLKEAMDAAAILGCNMVTTAPLNDGVDYPFELDYIRAFNDCADVLREGAAHRPDVKLSLEYKPSEPRVHCMFSNAGKMAALCEKIGLDNVGVTLDIGHALYAGEVPADSLCFLSEMKRLFYIHVNDNFRNWDWDMLPGSVNLWDYVEFAMYMKRVGYDGWITADVFPQRHDPIKIMTQTFEWMDFIFDLADKLNIEELTQMMNEKDGLDIIAHVRDTIFGRK